MQKKVLAINDISCVGRCSLTVALPIISASGAECSILPTSILSNHTVFPQYTFLDLTNEMKNICEKWRSLNLKYDYLYTGFLGSIEQVDLVGEIVREFKGNGQVLVDPAMADNGSMYKIFDLAFALKMKDLCMKADIICPNITEACFLTGIPYQEGPYSDDFIDGLIFKLGELGIKSLVLTGVTYDGINLGAVSYDYQSKVKNYYARKIIDDYFHGTGDCFASALVAALVKGIDLAKATKIAVDFTVDSIIATVKYDDIDKNYGVCFEEALPKLVGELNG